jgi:hypothetical protein
MQPVSRLAVALFAAVLGVLPALRAGCDLNCGARQVQPSGHCANHSQSPRHVPASQCGHDHSSTGTLTSGADATLGRMAVVAVPVPIFDVSVSTPQDHPVSLSIVHAVRATPPIGSSSLPLRI